MLEALLALLVANSLECRTGLQVRGRYVRAGLLENELLRGHQLEYFLLPLILQLLRHRLAVFLAEVVGYFRYPVGALLQELVSLLLGGRLG